MSEQPGDAVVPAATPPVARAEPRFSFEIRYDASTLQILQRAWETEPRRPKDVRPRPFWESLWVVVLASGILAVFGGWYFDRHVGEPRSTVFGVVLGGLVGGALGAGIMTERQKRLARWRRNTWKNFEHQATEAGTLRVELRDNGVHILSGFGMHACMWPGVRRIREIGTLVVVELWSGSIFPLAAELLPTPEARRELLDFVQGRLDAFGGGEVGLIRRRLSEQDAACPKCGYALRGCDGVACPECGLALWIELLGLSRPRCITDLALPPEFMQKRAFA